MVYKTLPPVGQGMSHLPELEFFPTPAMSSRMGLPVRKVWLHRWGVVFRNMPEERQAFRGVLHEFQDPHNEASSHLVFPGTAIRNYCAQMVPFSRKSWTEAAFNKTGISIECADAIWLGHDALGFAQLARITAYLLHRFGLPPQWTPAPGPIFNPRRGFCRHADGGGLAGGHTQCPTTDLELWRQFVGRTQAEYHRGEFRKEPWGR